MVNRPKSICKVQPAYSDVALVSSCVKDGLPQLELVFCTSRHIFDKCFLCGGVDVVVVGHELHEALLEDTGVQFPNTGR